MQVIPLWLQLSLCGLAFGFALLKGDWEERTYASFVVLAIVISLPAGLVNFGSQMRLEVAEDTLGFALAVFLALRSQKVWPMALASLGLAMLMTHAAQLLVHVDPLAYGAAQGTWLILGDVVIAAGAWGAWQARRRRAKAAEP